MSLELRTGDLFDQHDVDALAHGVNCHGVMGSGIAPQFRRRQPVMYAAYRKACLEGDLTLGSMFPWQLPNGRWIYNLASQDQPGRNAKLPAIEQAVTAAVEHAAAHEVRSIAMPRIGAGIGGLRWTDVHDLLDRLSNSTPVRLVVVTLPDTAS